MQLDPARYRHHFDRYEMGEDEKVAYMQLLWAIMEAFVTRAFHGEADAISLGIRTKEITRAVQPALDSGDSLTSTFNDAAGETMAGKIDP